MMRVLLLTALYLMAGFAAMIGLFVRAWGWSEYASDELYVVYFQQQPAPPYPFFMVSANGNGSDQQWQLASTFDTLTHLDCSPDGRTLAFLTARGHLYVVDQNGILYDRPLDQPYTALSLANNGMVALFESGAVHSGALLVSSDHALPLNPPYDDSYDLVELSSPGMALWYHTSYMILEVTAPTGEMIASFPLVIAPKWLASEQLITFGDIASIPAERVLVDTRAQKLFRLGSEVLNGVFSPDGTRRATNRIERGTSNIQIVISDSLSGDHPRQLTHDVGVIYAPVCFLTFRPSMLIDEG